MRKCCIKSIFLTLCVLMCISYSQEIYYAKLIKGSVIQKEIIGEGGEYIIKIREEDGRLRTLTIKNDVVLLKFGSKKVYDDITINTYYRFYTLGQDNNIKYCN